MSAYTTSGIAKHKKTLAANVEDTVTFTGKDLANVEVIHHSGAEPIYVRFGAAATVEGDACWQVLPLEAVPLPPRTSGDTVVHLISAATAVYSVADGG